jgi:ATP-dependent Clp protease ATP-binding subunit ClpA
VNIKSLIAKVDETTRSALEGAAGLCLARTHYDIEIEHYLLKLMDVPDGDFTAILKAFARGKQVLGPSYAELGKSIGARNKRALDRDLDTLNQIVQKSTGAKAGRLWRHSASKRAYRVHPATRQVLRDVLEQLSRAGEHEEPLWE